MLKIYILWAYDDIKQRPEIWSIHKTKDGAQAEKDRIKNQNNLTFIVDYLVND